MLYQEQAVNQNVNFMTAGDITKHGIVLPDKHPTDPSLFKVNIGDMTASANGHLEDGIWVRNAMSNFVRYRDIHNNPISYGSYVPILPFTPVSVTFPSGGAGQGIITGPAKTNVGLPDPENRDDLHMVAQTPKGSWIALDDKTQNIQIMFEGGKSSVLLSNDNITLEIGKGESSGIASDTSLSISKSTFIFKTRDAMMKFDESGFSIGFDAIEGQEKSSSLLVSRDSIKLAAGKNMQLNASDSISTKAEKITLEGIKDASLVGNQVKVNGAQLTSIKGNQIELEAFWNLQLKGMHVGLQASIQYKENTSMKYVKNITQCVTSTGIATQNATTNHIWGTLSNMMFAPLSAIFVEPGFSYIAVAASIAHTALLAANVGVNTGLEAAGVAWLAKTMPISVVTNVLGTGYAMAGAGNKSENESKFLHHAKDTKNKKSINSGVATSYSRKNQAMENLAVVDPLIHNSMTALYTGGVSPESTLSNNTTMMLTSGISGNQELAASAASTNIIGLNTTGITMTNSCSLLAPNGTQATLLQGCAGGTGESTKQCGADGFNAATGAQNAATSPFAANLITSDPSSPSGGGTCGVPPGCSGAAPSGGASSGCSSGNTSYPNESAAPGCMTCG